MTWFGKNVLVWEKCPGLGKTAIQISWYLEIIFFDVAHIIGLHSANTGRVYVPKAEVLPVGKTLHEKHFSGTIHEKQFLRTNAKVLVLPVTCVSSIRLI